VCSSDLHYRSPGYIQAGDRGVFASPEDDKEDSSLIVVQVVQVM
jgi:hypothetical protein